MVLCCCDSSEGELGFNRVKISYEVFQASKKVHHLRRQVNEFKKRNNNENNDEAR